MQSPVLCVVFDTQTDLKPGQELMCRVANSTDSSRIDATVLANDSCATSLWVTMHSIVPETNREPRFRTGPVYVSMADGNRELKAVSVDCSMTGLRVQGTERPEVGTDWDLRVHVGLLPVLLQSTIVRCVQPVGAAHVHMGVQIMGGERLMLARWKHFVDELGRGSCSSVAA